MDWLCCRLRFWRFQILGHLRFYLFHRWSWDNYRLFLDFLLFWTFRWAQWGYFRFVDWRVLRLNCIIWYFGWFGWLILILLWRFWLFNHWDALLRLVTRWLNWWGNILFWNQIKDLRGMLDLKLSNTSTYLWISWWNNWLLNIASRLHNTALTYWRFDSTLRSWALGRLCRYDVTSCQRCFFNEIRSLIELGFLRRFIFCHFQIKNFLSVSIFNLIVSLIFIGSLINFSIRLSFNFLANAFRRSFTFRNWLAFRVSTNFRRTGLFRWMKEMLPLLGWRRFSPSSSRAGYGTFRTYFTILSGAVSRSKFSFMSRLSFDSFPWRNEAISFSYNLLRSTALWLILIRNRFTAFVLNNGIFFKCVSKWILWLLNNQVKCDRNVIF